MFLLFRKNGLLIALFELYCVCMNDVKTDAIKKILEQTTKMIKKNCSGWSCRKLELR